MYIFKFQMLDILGVNEFMIDKLKTHHTYSRNIFLKLRHDKKTNELYVHEMRLKMHL